MNSSKQDPHALEHALAQLLVHAPHEHEQDFGSDISLEELQAYSEGGLSAERREQVLMQLDSKPELYELWLALEDDQEDFACLQTGSTASQDTSPSLLEQLYAWWQGLWSWQGGLTASAGLAMGAFAVILLLPERGLDGAEEQAPMLSLNPPITAPGKASQANVGALNVASLFHCTSWQTQPLSQQLPHQLCVSKSTAQQHWLLSNSEGASQALSPLVGAHSVTDIQATEGVLYVTTRDAQGGAGLSVLSLAELPAAKVLFKFDPATAADVVLAINVLAADTQGFEYQLSLSNGEQHNVYQRFE